MPISLSAIAFVIALGFNQFVAAQANWTGGSGSDQRWSLGENWAGGITPNLGQSISFPVSAVNNTARYDLFVTTVPSISISKCSFNALTDVSNFTQVLLTAPQAITGSCNGAGLSLGSVLDMRLTVGANATINSLTTDVGNTNTRRLTVSSPSGIRISAGTNLTSNANSLAGATGALAIFETRLASGNGIIKVSNGRVDFVADCGGAHYGSIKVRIGTQSMPKALKHTYKIAT